MLGMRGEKVVDKEEVLRVFEVAILIDGWVKVEEDRQVDTLLWIKHLVLKAKALNLVEVDRCIVWCYLVYRDSHDRLV